MISVSVSPCSILMRSGGVSAAQEVARLLATKCTLFGWGDSRMYYGFERNMSASSGLNITGVIGDYNYAYSSASQWTSEKCSIPTVDGPYAFGAGQTGLAGETPNEYSLCCPYSVQTETVGAVYNYLASRAFSGALITPTFFPSVYAAGVAQGSTQIRMVAPIARDTGDSNLYQFQLRTGTYVQSSTITPPVSGIDFFSFAHDFDFSTEIVINVEMKWLQPKPLIAGNTVVPLPIVSSGDGVNYISEAVAGRTIYALLDDTTVVPGIASAYISGLNAAFGSESIAFVALGTNKRSSDTVATFKENLELVRVKLKAAGFKYVVFGTSYAASIDTPGVDPYYVQAILEYVPLHTADCVLCDTYHYLPNYADGVTAGYYADVTHYNDTGKAAYAAAIGTLMLAT